MIISEQEKNRILNLHQISTNVNGVLITEQSNSEKAYYWIRVKQSDTVNWGKGWEAKEAEEKNIWWKAEYPHYETQGAIEDWNEETNDRGEKMRIIKRTKGKYLYSWVVGPFDKLSEAREMAEKIRGYNSPTHNAQYFSAAFVYQQCGTTPGFGTIVKVGTKCGETKGDVATETETDRFPNLELSDSLDLNKMPTFDPTKEGKVYKCGLEGCAAYVRSTLDQYQGNAWHAHRMNDNLVYSTFKGNSASQKGAMEQLFTLINKNAGKLSSNKDSFDDAARKISKSLVPSQSKFTNLEIDDVVGLYYDPSSMHSTAFFEGMTGYDDNGKGTKLGDGPFMVTQDGKEWNPNHLGKDVQFKAGKTLTAGNGPGLNTHLGFVGAKNDGKPIIFHNIHGQVWATPLDKLSKNGTAIVWAKRGEGTSGQEVVLKSNLDTVKQKFTQLYNKYFD